MVHARTFQNVPEVSSRFWGFLQGSEESSHADLFLCWSECSTTFSHLPVLSGMFQKFLEVSIKFFAFLVLSVADCAVRVVIQDILGPSGTFCEFPKSSRTY